VQCYGVANTFHVITVWSCGQLHNAVSGLSQLTDYWCRMLLRSWHQCISSGRPVQRCHAVNSDWSVQALRAVGRICQINCLAGCCTGTRWL